MKHVNAQITWHNADFTLLPEKLIYWPARKTLILADWHFGKIGHFRKAGIALPKTPFNRSLGVIDQLAESLQVQELLILGDLFHSDYNAELDYFGTWRASKKSMELKMVHGNHDILQSEIYDTLGIELVSAQYDLEGIRFIHDPADCSTDMPCMAGHIHPGVTLSGKGRQHLRLSCFYFSPDLAVLPAFGDFTGRSKIAPTRKDRIFIIAGNEVLEFDTSTGVSV